ncbi:MAG TPA: transglutaminaseTgpA domain-containing protein [Thermoanaerobaculia bacterium]|nr:transglutaminaseTgpA domain-containing protein [Thermoanaerobaculia bacterium]
MQDRRREIESVLVTGFAAAPLYLTMAVGFVPLLLFHGALTLVVLRIHRDGTSRLLPPAVMKGLAILALPFYFVDAVAISRGAFAASTHLILFIAVYQATESMTAPNRGQRLLTTFLLFIGSIATSTHMSVVLFVVAFAFLLFRELMHISHMETAAAVGREYSEAPSSRTAGFYLAGTAILGALLFPVLPRVRDPWVQGVTGALQSATTGLSDTINFNEERVTPDDTTIVARVWMGREAVPFFTPLRLRGAVYDRFGPNVWRQTYRGLRFVEPRRGKFRIAEPVGFARGARIQQRLVKGGRLLLPAGTYSVHGVPDLREGPAGAYSISRPPRNLINFEVSMSLNVRPLEGERVRLSNYPVTPAVAAMARSIAGSSTSAVSQAARVESYLARNFQYVRNAQDVGTIMTVDDFLLRQRRGHCEYFAAGMVALMTALGHPARIVGGFYGGRLNPLTGYFVLRREDAHAWVEVWDGGKWVTFDPTPTTLRPGIAPGNIVGLYASAISDWVNFFWDRYVLTFGLADQVTLAAEAITRARELMASGRRSLAAVRRMLASPEFLATLGFLLAAGTAAVVAARRRENAFRLLARHLSSIGVEVGPSMTMEEALRIVREKQPAAARELEPLVALYEAESFSARRDRTRLVQIRRRLAEIARTTL